MNYEDPNSIALPRVLIVSRRHVRKNKVSAARRPTLHEENKWIMNDMTF